MNIFQTIKEKNSSADDYYKFQQVNTFEVLWEGKSVGVYQTEQEAENIAENYALGDKYPEPKKPRPFDNYDLFTCLLFALAYTNAIMTLNWFLFVIVELCFGYFVYVRKNEKMMYQIIYTPRIQDELCVGEYKTQMEAERHLNQINLDLEFHHIKVINDGESISYKRDN